MPSSLIVTDPKLGSPTLVTVRGSFSGSVSLDNTEIVTDSPKGVLTVSSIASGPWLTSTTIGGSSGSNGSSGSSSSSNRPKSLSKALESPASSPAGAPPSGDSRGSGPNPIRPSRTKELPSPPAPAAVASSSSSRLKSISPSSAVASSCGVSPAKTASVIVLRPATVISPLRNISRPPGSTTEGASGIITSTSAPSPVTSVSPSKTSSPSFSSRVLPSSARAITDPVSLEIVPTN